MYTFEDIFKAGRTYLTGPQCGPDFTAVWYRSPLGPDFTGFPQRLCEIEDLKSRHQYGQVLEETLGSITLDPSILTCLSTFSR